MWKEITIPIIFLIIGWGLGILQIMITDKKERNRKIKDTASNLLVEFKEVMPRLVSAFYSLNNSLGILKKEHIDWISQKILKYPLKVEKITEFINKLSSLSDEEVRSFSRYTMEQEEIAKSVKKFYMPILKYSLESITYLDYQTKIIEINKNFEWLNEEIENSNIFFQRTFEPGLTTDNYTRININFNKSLINITKLFKTIADCIDDFITKTENKKIK
jgi:hypothetical protein